MSYPVRAEGSVNMIENCWVELNAGEQTLVAVEIQRCIFQEDSLSQLQFNISDLRNVYGQGPTNLLNHKKDKSVCVHGFIWKKN